MHIISLIHNHKLNRWHPVIFREAPMPGGIDLHRYKSAGHHTDGFKSRDEAINEIPKLAERLRDARTSLKADLDWDGEGIPALVQFFPDSQLD